MTKLLFFVIFSCLYHIHEGIKIKKYDCDKYHTLKTCQKSKYCGWNCDTRTCTSSKKYVGKGINPSLVINCPEITSTSVSSFSTDTTYNTTSKYLSTLTSTLTPTTTTTITTSTQTTSTFTVSTISTTQTKSTFTVPTKTTQTTSTTTSKLETTISNTYKNNTQIYPHITFYNHTASKSHVTKSKLDIILPVLVLTLIILILFYKLYNQKKKIIIVNNEIGLHERDEPILENNNYRAANNNSNPVNDLINEPEYLEPQIMNNNLVVEESSMSVPIYSEISDPEYNYTTHNNSNYDMVI